MFSYYSAICILSWMTLGILCILVHESGRIPAADKRLLYITYFLIALSAFAEWISLKIMGNPDMPQWILRAMKCADYILTPIAGGAMVLQMHIENLAQKAMMVILAVNTVFQILAAFNGWMIRIDNNNNYTHGPMYFIYLLVCLAILLLIMVQFIIYGKSFRRQNRKSLYAIMLLAIVGIVIQEVLPDGHRTAYLGLTLCAILMFIHYSEFALQAAEEHLLEQQIKIDTDALTGVFSRMAYSDVLGYYESEFKELPEGIAAFSFDVNGLKTVNDCLGHAAGDELIYGAAQCIESVFRKAGRCYRTGGDEFVVLADDMDKFRAEESLVHLALETKRWCGEIVFNLSLSVGYALIKDYPGSSAEELVRQADLAMYEAKTEYYQKAENDRRRKKYEIDKYTNLV